MKPNSEYRNILLSKEIDGESVAEIIKAIMSINYDDDLKEADYKDWERKPIKLFINSNGGSAYDSLALYDVIKASKTPVHTVALGWCMSGGLLIYMAGKKRFVGSNATFMYHDVAGWAHDKTEGMLQEVNEAKRLGKMYKDIITNDSLIKEEQLDDYINRKAEWYIPAKESLELKLADEYFKEF